MKHLILYLSALTILLMSCKSTESAVATTKPVAEAKAIPEAKSLLWEISGKGLEKSSFLFGTIHMIASEDYFLPNGTLSAIDATSKMVFEIDMADMTDPTKLMPMLQKANMKGDTTLKDLMSEEDYQMVADHFSEMGLPMFFMERLKPMFLTVFASGDFDPKDMQNGAVKSYEMEFASMAENSGKSTGGLETIEYQISIFDEIPYKSQADMLLESIRSSGQEDDTFKQLVEKYKSQDIEALYNMMQDDESTAEYEDILLVKRNKNWIPQMAKTMTEERTFFAVGAGHLGGPYGVINLLRKEGYMVKPVQGL